MSDKLRLLSRKVAWILEVPKGKNDELEAAFTDERFSLVRGHYMADGTMYWVYCALGQQDALQTYLREIATKIGVHLDTSENKKPPE
jgi:hypothetical protein